MKIACVVGARPNTGITPIDAVGEIMVKPRAPEKVTSSSEHASCQKANPLPE